MKFSIIILFTLFPFLSNAQYTGEIIHSSPTGGVDGLLVKSLDSYTVLDLDCAAGNYSATLRWARNSSLKWYQNMSFNDNLSIGRIGIGASIVLDQSTGDVNFPYNISKGGGSFKIDHPMDPLNKYLYHSFVESPDMMNVYNGNIITDEEGYATVNLPEYFEALNMDYRYQLTSIGKYSAVYIAEEVINNKFVIKSEIPNTKISWQVTGIRNDNYAQMNRIQEVVNKSPEEVGTLLHEDCFPDINPDELKEKPKDLSTMDN